MKKLIFFICIISYSLNAQENIQFVHATYIQGNDTLKYRILKPRNLDPSKKYPLILFMHGSGERGNDNKAQLTHGSSLFVTKENRENYNAFVVFPQCPATSYWANINYTNKENGLGFEFKENAEPMKPLELVMHLMESLVEKPQVDPERVYVSGLSMGGMATFELLHRQPNMYAAAIPICAGAHQSTVKNYAKKIPVWIIHGTDDTVINPIYSVNMFNAIKEAGGSPRLSIYENTGHDSWHKAFAEPDFLEWLFSKTKKE